MRFERLATGVVGLLAMSAGGVAAQGVDLVGSIGLTFGNNTVTELDSSPDIAMSRPSTLTADVTLNFGNGYAVAASGYWRDHALESSADFSDDEDPGTESQFGLMLLRDIGNNGSRVGVFYTNGLQKSQGEPADENYDVWLWGATGQANLGEAVLYGQVGVGDNTQGQDDGEGFNKGFVARAGVTVFPLQHTALNVDAQFASTPQYIDDDDPGRFFSFTVSGETAIPAPMPVSVQYGYSRTIIDSTDEGDHVAEDELFFGVRVGLGQMSSPRERWEYGTPYGTPTLPLRASSWTEWAD